MERFSDIDLHLSIRGGDVDAIRRVLMSGVDVKKIGTGISSPLSLAILYDQAEIAELLLDYGAAMGIDEGTGETLLHKAAFQWNSACLPLLLEHGADPLVRDHRGDTPLCDAALVPSEKNVNRLLEAQVRRQWADFERSPRLPSMLAEDDDLDPYPETTAEEISFRAASDAERSESEREEAWRCTVMIARYQLAAVNPTLPIGEAETLLMHHVIHGSAEDVRAWLPKANTVNFADHNVGWSLLISAIDRRSLEIVDLLLGAGADPNWFGHPRWSDTPIDYAIREGQHEIAGILKAHGARGGCRS